MSKRTVTTFAVVALASLAFGFQKPNDGAPIFGVSTNFVQVPVVVQRSGKHVSGLSKDDFTLRQDGKEQIIVSFEEVHAGIAMQSSNAGNGQAPMSPQIIIIALDLVDTPNLDRAYFIQELNRFLENASDFDGPIGLVGIERGGIRVLKGFTRDPRQIMAAVKEHAKAQPTNNADMMASDSRQLSDLLISQSETQLANGPDLVPLSVALKLREADEAMGRFLDRGSRIDVQLTIQQLAQALKGIPGRKSLLLVGSGFKFIDSKTVMRSISAGFGGTELNYSVENAGETLNQADYTWKLLNDANVAVYPIDTRRTVNTAFQTMDTSGANTPSDLSFKENQQADQDILASFKTISAATGGKPCFYRTDLDHCVREAIDDDHDYYLLGFYADKNNRQPGWHKIEVKSTEKASLRYRQGFMLAKFKPEDERKTDIGLALNSPFAYTALPFSGNFVSFTGRGAKKVAKFRLQLPPEAITVDEANNHIDFDVVAIARVQGGKEAARFSQRIDRKFPAENIAEIKRTGIDYGNQLELAPGQYGVWFVVRDNLSERTGSAVVPLTVP